MRKTTASDPVFEQLIQNDTRITYNLFYRIREESTASVWTDDHLCLMAQGNPTSPLWIALLDTPDAKTEAEIAEIICSCYAQNPKLNITVPPEYGSGPLALASRTLDLPLKTILSMNVYGCHSPAPLSVPGEMLLATPDDMPTVSRLLAQHVLDVDHITLTQEEADAAAQEQLARGGVYLWRDGDAAAMARIAHRTSHFARIALVVTEPRLRGRGYAPMLVKELAQNLLSQGVTPMMYADAAYAPSNRAYLKAGYICTGAVTTYTFQG